jgi:flagellar hook protein FlgE
MSFQQGLSGLNASSRNLEVIGNNIANANTYGAKSARAEFSHMYAAAAGGVSADIGIGVRLDAVSQQFTGGNITSTDKPTDLAISGGGFFQVSDGVNPTMYTRNGQFKVDRSGYIVNNDSMKLLGYQADGSGAILPGSAQPLQLPSSGIQPRATSNISMEINLDSRSAVTVSATKPFDPSDSTTYNNATPQTVYDDKGQPVSMTYYFQKASADTWNVYALANGTPVNGVDGDGKPVALSPQLTFSSNGSTVTQAPALPATGIPATTTASGVTTLPIAVTNFDFSAARQYGSSFSVTKVNQDGYAPGNLTGISIQENGTVMAQYSNGQSLAAGQVELANFRNPQGLKPVAGNMWAISQEAGEPVRGTPGSGSLGKLQAGALEESNVDLAGELVNMITAQRAYQANAQTIKTQDQVLQTLVNLR